MNNPKQPLLILGVYPETDGYPNVKYRLAALQAAQAFELSTLHRSIWQHNIPNRKITALVSQSWRFLNAHLRVVLAYLKHPDKQRVYIPYPAPFVAVLLTCLPKALQPKHLVIDAFISLYDALVIDRQWLSTQHVLAKCLYALEKRAFRYANAVIVDTQQNAEYYSWLFNLPVTQFVAIPLSTNENLLALPSYAHAPNQQHYTVVFIGTLIPLHGIEVILAAIALLAPRKEVQFKIIGHGQMAPLVEDFLQQQRGQVEWHTAWHSPEQLQEAIAAADICLGIFSPSAKAQRVCPLKIYAYTSAGRPVISAASPCLSMLMHLTH